MFKIGAQLIIWGSRILEDLPSVLDEASETGYEGVETSHSVFKDPESAKNLLFPRGLKLVALHSSIPNLYDADVVDKCLRLIAEAGGLYLTVSGIGHSSRLSMVDKDLEALNRVGERAGDYGIKVCYHNHDWEFHNRVMEKIIRETSQRIGLCVDVYWVQCAGHNPTNFIREQIDKVEYLHLKDGTLEDMKRRSFRELGQGMVDFPSILEMVRGKVSWLIVEQDRTDKDPKESMRISFEYTSKLIKTLQENKSTQH